MIEYIDKQALLAEYDRVHVGPPGGARKLIEEAPAADVQTVVHGYWIPSESDFDDDDTLFDVEDWCDWQCSACHTDVWYEDPMERRFLPKFCPNCGARMDGE